MRRLPEPGLPAHIPPSVPKHPGQIPTLAAAPVGLGQSERKGEPPQHPISASVVLAVRPSKGGEVPDPHPREGSIQAQPHQRR